MTYKLARKIRAEVIDLYKAGYDNDTIDNAIVRKLRETNAPENPSPAHELRQKPEVDSGDHFTVGDGVSGE